MQFRNTLIVLVLLVIVGGYVLLLQFAKPVDESQKLFNVKADDITSVVLKYPDHVIEVQRSGDAWKMVKPIKTDADKVAMGTLTREIADADVKRTVDEHPTDLAPFGLDKPAVTLVVGTKKKTFSG